MYRLKYYYASGRVAFDRFKNPNVTKSFLAAREQLELFPGIIQKIDIYQDDKLIATVYG